MNAEARDDKRAKPAKGATKTQAAAVKPAAPVTAPAAPVTITVPTAFVAPPRTIADITAILDSEKPDAAQIAARQAEADAAPPKTASASNLAQFYYDRGNARALLGRNAEALADGLKALEVGKGIDFKQTSRIAQFVSIQHYALGDPKQAIAVRQWIIRNSPGKVGLVGANRYIALLAVGMGNVPLADVHARKVVALVQESRNRPSWATNRYAWEATAEDARALIFEARGQYREAEAAFKKVVALRRQDLTLVAREDREYPSPVEQSLLTVQNSILRLARVKAKQGRLSEAEADARRALLEVLQINGKYNPNTPRFIHTLANILVEQGRYAEAEQLARAVLEIRTAIGMRDDAQSMVVALSQLANILTLQHKTSEAALVYARIDKAIAQWEPQRRELFLLKDSRISVLYASGQIEAGIAAAKELLKKEIARVGEKHFDVAAARGTLAIGYARAGRDAEAIREFKAALPIMMAAPRENADDDDTTVVQTRTQRLQRVAEVYIGLLARSANKSNDVAAETFALADAVRGRSVQQALAASSARLAAKDAALAELLRKEQDLEKQINAQLGALNNALSLPAAERDENSVRGINAAIEKLRSDRDKARQEINRRFPSYADLVDPKPPTVEQIKATLRQGEAMLSYYFGQEESFVWAVPKEGAVAFAKIPVTALTLEAKVRTLREAVEPQAAMVSDIPAFDLTLAHELYSLLLKPTEAAWKPAKNLIVVTNGALGLLPLSLLPTASVTIQQGEPPFGDYKNVPWLARTHAVSLVPSAAALRTLRTLPSGNAKRDKLIAFGDPLFSKQQAAEAANYVQVADAGAAMRGGIPFVRRSSPQLEKVDSAELAMLPRLPDTADELRSIATALEADPSKVLYLGKDANEKNVRSLNLSGFKILAFATHGLVPGELNGLTQPALALSAPDVSGSDGDGLLTMEEILALKLDADWVVLSACNTGTGAAAGAEAASGLGRAFFYAGTRALLVTNWAVHSASARELVSDLFARQARDPTLTRSEALRQAMTALLDGPGATDESGKTLFTYGHPLFWAPYAIIGDGG